MSLPAEALPPAFWGLPPETAQTARTPDQPSSGPRFASLLDQEESPNPPASPDLFGDDGFGLGDVLDIVNPLQHIPIVSTIYRAITGDEISTGARLAGGALFGGPIGLAGAVANAAVDSATGRDIGENALAMLGIGGGEVAPDGAEAVALAAAAGPAEAGPDAMIGDAAPTPDQTDAALNAAALRSDTGVAPGEAAVLAAANAGKQGTPPGRAFGGVMAPAEATLPQAANDSMDLSPAAHAALMRLAGNPAIANATNAAPNSAVQSARATLADAPTPLAPPAPEPGAVATQSRPSSASSLLQAQESATAQGASPTAPGAIAGTPALKPEEIPAAMMAALEKYEALRRSRS